MLQELRLKDFVLIREAHISFKPGFTVLTGETGAGKSIFMQALGLLLGRRGGPHLIRPGAEAAVVEAVFFGGQTLAKRLEAMGLEPCEEMILRRVIASKSRLYVNGSPANLQMVSRLTQGLILLASQHEHQILARPEDRLKILDQYGGLKDLVLAYQRAFEEYRRSLAAYEDLAQRMGQLERERDFLRFQIQEIESLNPKPGEDKALMEERSLLRNLHKLQRLVGEGVGQINSALEGLSWARKNLSEAQALDARMNEMVSRLENIFYELEDISFGLQDYLSQLPHEGDKLEEIESRLAELERLKRKYGGSLNDVLAQLKELKEMYAQLEYGEEELEKRKQELDHKTKETLALARTLSERRKEAAQGLSKAVRERLSQLGLKGTRFLVEVRSAPLAADNLGPQGLDQVEFMVATNPKAPLRPLSMVASGGELSRIFLALKVVVARDQEAQLFLFDEIDAGIGGLTASKVGALLRELAQKAQVICITHLPQIAVLADHHLVVEKRIEEGEALTQVRVLSQQERVQEIARMLGQEDAQELAQKMLQS